MKSTAQSTPAVAGSQPDKSPKLKPAGPVRVLLVDDHPLMRQGIRGILQQHPGYEVCAEAGDAPQALELARRHRPHLAIVDIELGPVNGIELIKNLLTEHHGLRGLVMSMHDESLYAERALRAGAMGYLMKLEAGDRMMEAVERILAGGIYLSERMSGRMLQHFVDHAGAKPPRSPVETLSEREREVLQLIASGYGTQAIANRLQQSAKAIESLRESLKHKLGLSFGVELVHYAIQWAGSEPPM